MTRLAALVGITLCLVAASPAALAQPGRWRAPRPGELAVFSGPGFRGQVFYVTSPSLDLHTPFPVRSFMMAPGERWALCTGPNFRRDCRWFYSNEPDRGAATGIAIRSARSEWIGGGRRRWR